MPPRQYVVLAAAFAAAFSHVSAIVITDLGLAHHENFDSLVASDTGAALPIGWSFHESGLNANSSYTAGTGSGNGGDTYSFGARDSTERALGSLLSGNLAPSFGVKVSNETGGVIDTIAISFFGEQWRLGSLGRTDRLEFAYSFDATVLSDGTWSRFDPLDVASLDTSAPVGLRNGNAAANRVSLAGSLTGLSLESGSSLWLRWTDFNAEGADDGLAIDDFSLIARGPVAAPPRAVPDSLPMGACLGAVLLGLAAVRRRFVPAST